MPADDLEQKLQLVPTDPGVYLWKDEHGEILYVGKAKVLRNRVRSYFQRRDDLDPKTRVLVSRIRDVDWIVTDSEKEALILENTLIKKHRPRYNVLLKDDKRFLCVRLALGHDFPRLYVVRRIKRDGDAYFGPFDNATAARETLRFLNTNFPLRKCGDQQFAARTRPCLQHQIGRCHAPCVGLIDKERYAEIVHQVRSFFAGRYQEVIAALTAQMQERSAAMAFEEAARLRDRLRAIEATLQKQKVVDPSLIDRDVFGLYREGAAAVVCQLYIRNGAITGQRTFALGNVERDDASLLAQVLGRFYSEDVFIPRQILVPVEPDGGRELYAQWLEERSGHHVELRLPQRGEAKQLVEMAANNARRQFTVRRSQLISHEEVLEEIRQRLQLPRTPETIECFDVSNVSGKLAVASLVRFANGEPDKGGYRRFRLRLRDEPDDYAMMHEALARRMTRGIAEGSLPDLLLIDGGKGHLNVAREVLRTLELLEQPVASIAKVKDLAPGDPSAKDKIYLPERKNPVNLKANSNALHLLQRIRDEAHRFAIEYHRTLRSKKMVGSVLDEIPGLGAEKKKALLKTFGTIKAVKAADIEELQQAPGIGPRLAHIIYGYLKDK